MKGTFSQMLFYPKGIYKRFGTIVLKGGFGFILIEKYPVFGRCLPGVFGGAGEG